MNKKLLLIKKHAYNAWEYDQEFLNNVKELGYDIYLHDTEKTPYTQEECECEVFATTAAFLKIGVENFPNLKFVQGLSAGYDHFPLDEFKKRGIALCNATGAYGVPISEFIMSGILSVYKKIRMFEQQQQNKEFIRTADLFELAGKTAMILGTGDIGIQLAKRLQAFDTKTIGFNRHPKALKNFDEVYDIADMMNYIPHSDFVILALPLSETTYHLADKAFFDCMKPSSIFVNVGRGAVCNEDILIKVLQENKIQAAILDVYEKEPLDKESPLWNMENAYVYPHTMSGSDNAFKRMEELIYRNLKAYKEGAKLENLI